MSELNKDEMVRVADMIRDRYTERLNKFGDDPRTLGWDTVEHQMVRFNMATTMAQFTDNSILDIGCGLGDFLVYLQSNEKVSPSSYTGVDLNPNLINRCKQRFPQSSFKVLDLMRDDLNPGSADIVCMFGLLNLRFSSLDNIVFAKEAIRRAFMAARSTLIVDMLSVYRTDQFPKEDFIYYYKPEEMLSYALSLTPKVQIRHDYAPIPQREFMMALRH